MIIVDILSECVEWVCGWGGVSFLVTAGKVVKSGRGWVCGECRESLECGEEIALVELGDSGESRVYHCGCLPGEFRQL